MTQLSCFSDEDIEIIVSLPYRAAMNVSYADDEEGECDDEREMHALKTCIIEIAKLHEGVALTKEIAENLLNSQDKWLSWSQGVFNIEMLCERAILALKAQASDDEIRSYVEMVLELATTVAQAYGEFGEEEEPEKGFFGKAVSIIAGGFRGEGKSYENHPMNVSASEDCAISNIAAALKKNM